MEGTKGTLLVPGVCGEWAAPGDGNNPAFYFHDFIFENIYSIYYLLMYCIHFSLKTVGYFSFNCYRFQSS